MTTSDKIRVAILYGGRSAEHEISLRSAANVIEYLDKSLYEVIPIGIDKKGNWFLGNEVFVKSLENNTVPQLNKDTWFTPEWIGKPVEAQQFKQLIKRRSGKIFDVIFPVVHGTLCEDGTLQGLLELADIPYVGCGVLSSAIGMDKDVSKRLAHQAGINIAPYLAIKKHQWQHEQHDFLTKIEETLTFPVFVKPANTGSSIGITKVKTKEKLSVAIDDAFQFDTKVIVEKALDVMELELATLESLQPKDLPIVSIVGQIKPHHEFYSYEAKYIDENGASLIIPAPISDGLKNQAQQIAQELFLLLECEGMARVDLFLDTQTQQIYFNEINTIPGFTKISMYPKLMEASGFTYANLLNHLIKLAIQRHQIKSQLKRSYAD